MRGQSVTKNEEKDAKLLNVKADHETRNGIFLVVPRLFLPLQYIYCYHCCNLTT